MALALAALPFEFIERKLGSKLMVVQRLYGLNVGDPLTDNSHRPDGYRFHDVFHMSYAVHLGWSPVLRALLKLKRKYWCQTTHSSGRPWVHWCGC
jgi:hypothetical protein